MTSADTHDRYAPFAGKWLGGRERPDASVEYEYARDGRIAVRTANGVRQTFEHDARGRLFSEIFSVINGMVLPNALCFLDSVFQLEIWNGFTLETI